MSKPIVAVVGRPNVGKSTLFNKLCGQRLAIVEDTPGITRDRIFANCEWSGHEFLLVDTGGIEPKATEGRLFSGTLGVPAVMLREEKDTFLDDMTIEQLGQRLGVKVEVLPTGGGDEAKALLRSGLHIARRRRP